MKASNLEIHSVNLHILSPIHIGTDQELDPFSYIIKDNRLILIDLIKWIENYPDQDHLLNMIESNSFAEIRTFITENADPDEIALVSIPIDSDNIIRTYNRVIAQKDTRNQLLIDPMMRNEISQKPYIPGSSIKGSMRTAIANFFVETAGVTSKNQRKTYKPIFEPDYDEKIFGRINEDPMRNLKLSDVFLEKYGSMIVEAEEFALKEDKAKTPKGYKEVSTHLCHNGKHVIYPLRFSLNPFPLHGQIVDVSFVIDILYKFYVQKFKNEYQKFYCSDPAKKIRQEISPMCFEIANLKTNETLIRIGHFSHVECITFDNVREPQTRIIKGKRMPYGTTRTLANGLYPFGWAKLEFTDLESQSRKEEDWPFSIQKVEKSYAFKKTSAEKLKEAAENAEKLKMREEEDRLAKEKRKAEIEAMSPEERDIAAFDDPDLPEQQVVEIFNRLDGFSEQNKMKVAQALKGYWEVNNKWAAKDCSKKQKIKVQKLKTILGEN